MSQCDVVSLAAVRRARDAFHLVPPLLETPAPISWPVSIYFAVCKVLKPSGSSIAERLLESFLYPEYEYKVTVIRYGGEGNKYLRFTTDTPEEVRELARLYRKEVTEGSFFHPHDHTGENLGLPLEVRGG